MVSDQSIFSSSEIRQSELVEHVASLAATYALAERFAHQITWPACVYLQGGLGAGKTSFCQAVIAALGNSSPVTSPTYNLLQEYPVNHGTVYHMDLFRLHEPSELEYLGLADLWQAQAVFLIEWPDRGIGFLPDATHIITITADESGNPDGRTIRIEDVS